MLGALDERSLGSDESKNEINAVQSNTVALHTT